MIVQMGPTDSVLCAISMFPSGPSDIQVKQNIGAVKAMKMSLEKVHSQMLDMVTTLQSKAAKDEAFKSKCTEVSLAAEAVKALVQELRTAICVVDEGVCGEEAAALNSRLRSQLEAGDAHLLGWRAMNKRIRAMMM